MNIEQILAINFTSLKERNSLISLGVKNSSIFICKIPYFDKFYYLIKNNKREYIKIYFADKTELEINAKTFISTLEPIEIKVSADSGYHNPLAVDNSPATLENIKDSKKHYCSYPLKFVNQEQVDSYFINQHLIKEENLQNFLFKIPVSEKVAKFIKPEYESDKLIVSFEEFRRILPKSILKDNCIYTNYYLDCLTTLNKLENLFKNIPNLTIYQLKRKINSKINQIVNHVNHSNIEDNLLKIDSKLDQLIESL